MKNIKQTTSSIGKRVDVNEETRRIVARLDELCDGTLENPGIKDKSPKNQNSLWLGPYQP